MAITHGARHPQHIVSSVSTEDLPPGDRLPFWQELLSSSIAPLSVRIDQSAAFTASLRTIDLGAIQLMTFRLSRLDASRTPKLIRQSDPESYVLGVNLRGRATISQDRRTSAVAPHEFTLYDVSRVYRTSHTGGGGVPDAHVPATQEDAVAVQLPRSLLPIPERKTRRLYAAAMPGREGIGALLVQHLIQLAAHADQIGPADAARLGGITVDLIAAALARHLDAERDLPPDTRQEVTYARVRAFIDRHLPDPALSPEMVAAAHHISVRSLHRLFQVHGLTVAGWIRHRRLERCRRDLADPLLRSRSIQAIAARWGFRDGAHFTRVFTAANGIGPRDYRRSYQGSSGGW